MKARQSERCLRKARRSTDRPTIRARAFSLRGLAELTFHNAASARLRAERLACTRLAGDPWLIARILAASAEMAADQGDYARAKLRFAASLELGHASRDRSLIAQALACSRHVARLEGEEAHAATCYAEALTIAHILGDRIGMAVVRHNQAYIALHQGDLVRATACLQESLTIGRARCSG